MTPSHPKTVTLNTGDALLLVDIQNDFLPGGSLAVPGGDQILPAINQYLSRFKSKGLPVFATRDWHPHDHCSFTPLGGIWPVHCVRNTPGSQFPEDLRLPKDTIVVSKAMAREKDAYSGFEDTGLAEKLKTAAVRRLLIGGLATDYCVLNTVKDALKNGFSVLLLTDAIRAVNVAPDDGKNAIREMIRLGAKCLPHSVNA